MKLAERMSRIGIESAFDVLVRARALEAQGRSVIHLEIGEPDFPTPPHVVEAASASQQRAMGSLFLERSKDLQVGFATAMQHCGDDAGVRSALEAIVTPSD